MSRVVAPILLIIFNRPETTEFVFEAIRAVKPPKLYISADAPRPNNEEDIKNCERARSVVKKIDWECDVKYRFLEENLGCGWGPSSAITWAFENEDRLIILEDDCVPSIPFFNYCNYLLEKFVHDTRVWVISGRSHQVNSSFFVNQDYLFTHYGHSWGWATWKRCWEHFDIEMKDFPDFYNTGGAKNILSSSREGKFYNKLYHRLYHDKQLHTHVWDFQFGYAVLKNGGLSIVPAKNLIENIGVLGTHSSSWSKLNLMKADQNFQIKREPKFIMINKQYESLHFQLHIKKVYKKSSLLIRFIKKILKIRHSGH